MYNPNDYINSQLQEIEDQITELQKIINENTDKDMVEMAKSEILQLNSQKDALNKALTELENGSTSQSTSATKGDCIIEIRAGTGGDEAGLFAHEIMEMYMKFCDAKKWKVSLVSKNEGGIGNIKEAVFEVNALNGEMTPYELFEYESGVHRVQRVPVTESGGRIHTSTATVAVLPIIEEKELVIRSEDLRVDTFRAGGAGGQHVNKTESAIRITHLPTGVVVQCQDERSQHKNRASAMSVLRSRIFEIMKKQHKSNIDEIRADQIGTGDRSEKIKTYNFPQDRITDHRIKVSWHNINRVMLGDLETILKQSREMILAGTSGNDEECP